MTELERSLTALGREVAFPETPDVSGRVLERLVEPPPRGHRRRRALVAVLAVLAVAIAAAMAVPQARTAILDFFHLRGATVERVETLPAVPLATVSALELGRPVTVGGDRPPATFPDALVPAALGAPAGAYVSATVPGGRLSLVYAPGAGLPRSPFTGVGLLVTQVHGALIPGYVDKMAEMETGIARLTVDGAPALWLEGAPHYVAFRSPDGSMHEDTGRLAGNTLLIERDGLLVRIEGEISRERAVEIAESLGP